MQYTMPNNDSPLQVPAEVYARKAGVTLFNQLAVKVEMDEVSNQAYYGWLDRMKEEIVWRVRGAQIAEKPDARSNPPLNIAVYYDTDTRQLLPTGALLRTSCNIVTHAFCAYKAVEDEHSVRPDYRYIFEGEERLTIQRNPTGAAAARIVRTLMQREDLEHPGHFVRRDLGIDPRALSPALALDDLRYTFFVWLDGRDALRCSIDRYETYDLRKPREQRRRLPLAEVELAIYPHIGPEVARDPRVPQLIATLRDSLCEEFNTRVTKRIKYQRCAAALGLL